MVSKLSFLKYITAYSTAILFFLSIHFGIYWLVIAWMFVGIQIIDLFMKPSFHTLSKLEEDELKSNKIYDIIVWMVLPLQFSILTLFLHTTLNKGLSLFDFILLTISYGMCAAIYAINVAHELGHRTSKIEQWMAKILLISTQYGHFFLEHNYGHHKHVGTHEDGATARRGEHVYRFFIRSLTSGYWSAWKIEFRRLENKKRSKWSPENEMIQFSIIQLLLLTIIVIIFGTKPFLLYCLGSLVAIFFLEATNYVQHYGLIRKRKENGDYEKVQLSHSWNSNYPFGRMILFELSRHSDHHHKATKKYQTLDSHQDMPHLPTGYPGMILLALFPPLYFKVMDNRITKQN